jgi:hypothetical protein
MVQKLKKDLEALVPGKLLVELALVPFRLGETAVFYQRFLHASS